MSVGIQINFDLTGVSANVPISIGISIGEPKLVTHQISHQQRICAACGREYRDESVPMIQYPMCPACEDDLHARQYQNEISQPRFLRTETHLAAPTPVGKSDNEINNVNWKEEGF